MKRFSFLLMIAVLGGSTALRAQDAATEERLNKLSGQIEDLIAVRQLQQKQIVELNKEIAELREQLGKPNTSYATHDDLKQLSETIREVDRKRIDDAEKVQTELLKLSKQILASTSAPKKAPVLTPADHEPPARSRPEKGYEYVVQKGDTLSTIAQAYREQNIKVSTDDILKANPGLKPEKLQVGQKIFIPAPGS